MTTRDRHRNERKLLRATIARLRASVMAVVFGLVSGAGLFAATAWLLIRGGDPIGPHLSLLGIYLPGYNVSWAGAFIGFGYALLIGAAVGWSVAWLYNWIAGGRQLS